MKNSEDSYEDSVRDEGETFTYEERLKEMRLPTLKYEREGGDLLTYKLGKHRKDGLNLVSLTEDRDRQMRGENTPGSWRASGEGTIKVYFSILNGGYLDWFEWRDCNSIKCPYI